MAASATSASPLPIPGLNISRQLYIVNWLRFVLAITNWFTSLIIPKKHERILVTLFYEHFLFQLLDPLHPHSSPQIFKHLVRKQFKLLKQISGCFLEHHTKPQTKLVWRLV